MFLGSDALRCRPIFTSTTPGKPPPPPLGSLNPLKPAMSTNSQKQGWWLESWLIRDLASQAYSRAQPGIAAYVENLLKKHELR